MNTSQESKQTIEADTISHHIVQDDKAQEMEEVHFDDPPPTVKDTVGDPVPKAPRNESMAQRARREHQEYIKQRDANPAFVPTRGGFFLHDDRSATSHSLNGRQFVRGRGRSYGPAPSVGYVNLPSSDLHG
jgi:hypothetical protein